MDKPKIVSFKDSTPPVEEQSTQTPHVEVPPLPSEPTTPKLPEPLVTSEVSKPPLSGGGPPWIEREQVKEKEEQTKEKEEEKEDELAQELTQPRVISIEPPRLVKEYREQAARDILPPKAEPAPLTIEQERDRARKLAQQIHEERSSSEGLFDKVKRFLRFG